MMVQGQCIAWTRPPARVAAPRPSSRGPGRVAGSPVVVAAQSSPKEGASASGYAVQGLRPTSPRAWSIISKELKKNGLKFARAADTQKRGTVVIDIRPCQEYQKARIPGAANAEFFKSIDGLDPVKLLRRAVFAFFGILNGTEYNDSFLEDVEGIVGGKKNANIVLYCNIGGQLEPWGSSEDGRQSRSLTAAFELYNNGFKNVRVLEGGLDGYLKQGYETE